MDERECEALSSRDLTWEHEKCKRNHQKSMILKMNQDTHGDVLRYQESPGMTVDTTRLHKTWFQEVNFLRNLKILTKSWPMFHTCAWIQNLGWTQLESTLKIILIGIENSSFGCNLTFEIWISDGPPPATGGPSDFWIMSHGGKWFAPKCPRHDRLHLFYARS